MLLAAVRGRPGSPFPSFPAQIARPFSNRVYARGMDQVLTRGFLGSLATRGWRNYLAWGGATIVNALGLAFVYRFASGTLSGADLVAFLGVLVPFCQQLYQRHAEKIAGVADAAYVNPAALA